MISYLTALFALYNPSPQDVEALRQSAPYYLTTETAEVHLVSARVAARRYRLDPDLLLSIAHHESRYVVDTVTPEIGGKVSCGVMTPYPVDKGTCPSEESKLQDGYMAGAAHLRGWFDACKDNRYCALLGYAGGFALIFACNRGPVFRFKDHGDNLCNTPGVFMTRRNYIRNLRVVDNGRHI